MPKDLEKKIGYRFGDSGYLETALTHKSSIYNGKNENTPHYERLEFLGDRVLNLSMADLLLSRFSDETEGEIARRYSTLVSGQTLAKVADKLSLGDYARLSEAEGQAGGREKQALLADLTEALIGAIYRDGGFTPARTFVERFWSDLIALDPAPPKDAKSALQEWAQSATGVLPVYSLLNQSGPDHAPIFEVEVTAGKKRASAKAASKKIAEKTAAAKLIKIIKEEE